MADGKAKGTAAIGAISKASRERLERLLAPVGLDAFMAEYWGRKPLLIPGQPDKHREVMSWAALDRILSMTAVWNDRNFRLFLDSKPVPAAAYMREAPALGGATALQPDAARAQEWIRRGASLVLNDVDTLSPGTAELRAALGQGFGAKVQSNLYCSRKSRQAFAPHFDLHDVFAVHCEGEKAWRVFEGREELPINHPRFQVPEADRPARMGGLLMEPVLKPGDVLYLPRGWYHDALASSNATLHLSFGVTTPKGVDAIDLLRERALLDPAFRADLSNADLAGQLRSLGRRIATFAEEPEVVGALREFLEGFPYPHETWSLEREIEAAPPTEAAPDPVWVVTGDQFRVIRRGERWALAGKSDKAVELPPAVREPTAWVLEARRFSLADLKAQFPKAGEAALRTFVGQLEAMKVVRRAA